MELPPGHKTAGEPRQCGALIEALYGTHHEAARGPEGNTLSRHGGRELLPMRVPAPGGGGGAQQPSPKATTWCQGVRTWLKR